MIYSKIDAFYHLPFTAFKTLDQCKFEDDDIFYHHHYYEQKYNIPIYDCLDEPHWEHMRKNKNVKLFHENCSETFSFKFLNEIDSMIQLRQIDPNQLYVVVLDELHRYYVAEGLRLMGIHGVTVGVHNLFLQNLSFVEISQNKCEYKFSALSRHYKAWRLKLYVKLLESGCLDNFKYSFYNLDPYEHVTYTVDEMTTDLKNVDILMNPTINKWLNGIPYKLDDSNNVFNSWDMVTYNTIMSADFHLAIETHYDLFYYVPTLDGTFYKMLAPNFITEKIYKGISCEKPFIAFGTPFILDGLRKLGFETFSPYIDETYDTISDNEKRLNAIVKEVARLTTLSTEEYQAVVISCKEIARRNLEKLTTMSQQKQWSDKFIFIKNYVVPDEKIHIY